jgi:anti-anti-sigma factor
MVAEFSLDIEEKDNCVVIKTNGYINNIGGQKIVDEFNKHYDNGVNHFVLNLAESKIVNSIGISYLIEIIEKLNGSKGKLIFTNLDSTIEKTFTIMGLFQFADKAEDVETAFSKI